MIGRISLLCLLVVVISTPARALIEVAVGNDPVRDRDWPAGSLDVANAKNRLGWWEGPPFGGGESHFVFKGDAQALTDAVSAFSHIKAPSLLIVVHDGPGSCTFIKDPKDPKSDGSIDYELALWNPASFHHLYNHEGAYPLMATQPDWHGDVPPPRLDVYATDGRIDWSRIPVPKVDGLVIQDERATANGYAPDDGAVVRGAVYDMETSKPVAGAEAVLTQRKDTTWEKVADATVDADGRFEIKHAPPGGSYLIIRHPGHAPRSVAFLSLPTKNTCKTFPAIRLAPAVDQTGTVTDPAGKPLPNVTVRADALLALDGRGYAIDPTPTTITDADGRFTFHDLPRGSVRYHASADNLHQVKPVAPQPIPEPNLVLQMASTGTVRGHATAKDGQSVSIVPEGGNVVGSWGGSTQLNPDGSFEFTNVPPGRYVIGLNLRPDHPETDPRATRITVTPGQTTEVDLK